MAFAASCGDGIVDAGEDCDPPGMIACPAGSPGGAYLACNSDCTCPAPMAPTCPPSPQAGCLRAPTHGALIILNERSKTLPLRKRLVWTWRKGTVTSDVASFGDPVGATSYQLSLYDEVGGQPEVKM